MGRLREGIIATAITALTLVGAAGVANANPATKQVSGHANGYEHLEFYSSSCDFVHTFGGGKWKTSTVGEGTYTIDGCVSSDLGFSFAGVMTVKTRRGTLTGTVHGPVTLQNCNALYDYTLQITGGSGVYAGATGALHLAGNAMSNACRHGGVGDLVEHFKVSGSVTA